MDLQRELEVSKRLAIRAGEEILQVYEKGGDGLFISYKEDQSPLTEADTRANQVIVAGLRAAFPSYALLSEEEKDNKSRLENDWCFIVDPLDGTKEFIKRNDMFTVNIALAYRHQPVMGVIYVPVSRDLYWASREEGAFWKPSARKIKRLRVTDITGTDERRAVLSNSHTGPKMQYLLDKYQIRHFMKVGSSLKGCMIARGDAEIYYRYGYTCEWDTAAMQCIVEEAGGILRQMDNSPMVYNREDTLNRKGFYIINCQENYLEGLDCP